MANRENMQVARSTRDRLRLRYDSLRMRKSVKVAATKVSS